MVSVVVAVSETDEMEGLGDDDVDDDVDDGAEEEEEEEEKKVGDNGPVMEM